MNIYKQANVDPSAEHQDKLRRAINRDVYMVHVNCAGSVSVKSLEGPRSGRVVAEHVES